MESSAGGRGVANLTMQRKYLNSSYNWYVIIKHTVSKRRSTIFLLPHMQESPKTHMRIEMEVVHDMKNIMLPICFNNTPPPNQKKSFLVAKISC